MQEVNVSELRNHLPEYLARAELGEEILVTRRGRVIARLASVIDNGIGRFPTASTALPAAWPACSVTCAAFSRSPSNSESARVGIAMQNVRTHTSVARVTRFARLIMLLGLFSSTVHGDDPRNGGTSTATA